MIKLAFSTLGCPEWPLETVAAAAHRHHIDAVEFRGLNGELDIRRIPALAPGNIAATRAVLGGTQICVFGSSLTMDSSISREDMLEEGRAIIDICSADRIPAIRVFGNQVFPGEEETAALNHIAAGLCALCAYAEDKNVSVLLEVHGNVTTLPRLSYLAEKVPSPAFGILWDVAHTDKQYKDDFASFYRPLLPLIRHIHIKDHFRLADGTRLCDVGRGEIPLAAIVRSLIKDGYQGYFSLEWEKMWHPELAPLEDELAIFADFMRATV